MDFPLSIIEKCLEQTGTSVTFPDSADGAVFSFADTDDGALASLREPELPSASGTPVEGAPALLVTTVERAREIAASGPCARPILAVAPPAAESDQEGEPRSSAGQDTGQHGNPENAAEPEARTAPEDALPFPVATTRLSCAAVCSLINRHLVALREWDASLANLVLAGGSVQQLIDASEPVIRHYVALSDALFALVAATKNFPPIDDMSRTLIETGSYPSSMIPRVERLAEEQRWHAQNRSRLDQGGNSINPLPSMSRIYRLERNYAAHLVMVSPQAIKPQEQFLFDVLADRIGACLEQAWKTGAVYSDRGTTFFTALLNGDFDGAADLEGRARRFDLPIEGVFELGVISGAEERGGVTHFARQIKSALKSCQATVIGQRIYVLLVSSGKGSGKIAAMEDTLFSMVSHLHAEMGLSSRFEQLSSCRMARMEADVALRSGAKNKSKYLPLAGKDPYLSCVFRFNRYFPCYLVDPYADTAEFLSEYAKAPNLVNRLRKADAENGTDDFGLLKIYLYFDCSIKKTAELLGMHRNTVVYRLNKMRNDFHIDLDDCDTRLFLHYLFGVLE